MIQPLCGWFRNEFPTPHVMRGYLHLIPSGLYPTKNKMGAALHIILYILKFVRRPLKLLQSVFDACIVGIGICQAETHPFGFSHQLYAV